MTWTEPFDMSDPEQVAKARARQEAKDREARDAYTWENAQSDLAYGTPLTIFDAGRVIRTLDEEDLGIHPYDALPLLMKIFEDRDPARSEKIEVIAWNMVKMIKLGGLGQLIRAELHLAANAEKEV